MIDAGMSPAEVDDALNKASGLLGLSELSNDMRDLLAAADAGNAKAQLAVEVFVYRVAKYIGAYLTVLPAVDAVVFTGGIGENSVPVRRMICQYLARLGAVLDESRNREAVGGKTGPITADGSRLPVWVIPTNEELMIARDTAAIVGGQAR
jgi:acetate kinase